MRILITLCVSLALVSLSSATYWHYHRPRPSNVAAGDPCTPSYAATCGNKQVLSENITAATDFGPNVCLNTTTYQVQTFSYSFQRYCNRRRRRCTFYCTCTSVCNGTMRNVTRRSVDCCEGFASSPSSNEFSYWHRHRHHRLSRLQSEGCPMRLMNTVVDCLRSSNLTQFQAQLANEPDLNAALQSDSRQYTIFAPSDEAFDQLSDIRELLLFSGLSRRQTLEAHIANQTIPTQKFIEGAVIRPLEESTLLHITKFERWQRLLRRYSVQTFISGAELTQGNVCQARNGIVHILDSFVLFSSESISDILTRFERFSTFKRLLDAADLTKFMNGSRNNSRTVFAPTNDAFSQLPAGAVDCLLRSENRRALGKLLLAHVTFPAEYNSTLALRTFVYTFSGIYLVVNVTDGVIYLTRGRIPIQDVDQPARNGVVHTLPRVIVPSFINFARLCPDMGTATTPTTTTTTTTTATTSTTATSPTTTGTVGTASTPSTTTGTTGTPEVPTDLFISGSGDIVPPIPVVNDGADYYEKAGDDYEKEDYEE